MAVGFFKLTQLCLNPPPERVWQQQQQRRPGLLLLDPLASLRSYWSRPRGALFAPVLFPPPHSSCLRIPRPHNKTIHFLCLYAVSFPKEPVNLLLKKQTHCRDWYLAQRLSCHWNPRIPCPSVWVQAPAQAPNSSFLLMHILEGSRR